MREQCFQYTDLISFLGLVVAFNTLTVLSKLVKARFLISIYKHKLQMTIF